MRRIKGLQFWPLRHVLVEKYRLKQHEAQALNDFLLPMLTYQPESRASAQEMLNHYWLNMPADHEAKLSDREYERMLMIKKNKKKEVVSEPLEGDIVESDSEINMADDEDNEEYISDDYEESNGSCEDAEVISIQNFNNSFAAYGQHVNLAALDRANPQFAKVKK
jgi:serine/threonine protein kinase